MATELPDEFRFLDAPDQNDALMLGLYYRLLAENINGIRSELLHPVEQKNQQNQGGPTPRPVQGSQKSSVAEERESLTTKSLVDEYQMPGDWTEAAECK